MALAILELAHGQELSRRNVMVAAYHLTLPTTVARPTAKNTTDLMGRVASVRTTFERLGGNGLAKTEKRAAYIPHEYPANPGLCLQ